MIQVNDVNMLLEKIYMILIQLPSSCLLNLTLASGCLKMISVTWLINFQMVFIFFMSLSSLFSSHLSYTVQYSSTKKVAC